MRRDLGLARDALLRLLIDGVRRAVRAIDDQHKHVASWDDFTQDTVVRVWAAIERGVEPSSWGAYAYRSAVNRLIDETRKEKAREPKPPKPPKTIKHRSDERDREAARIDWIVGNATQPGVRDEVMKDMRPQHRERWRRHYLHRLTIAEIVAERVAVDPGRDPKSEKMSVWQDLKRARAHAERVLAARGLVFVWEGDS